MTAEALLREARAAGATLTAVDERVQISGRLPNDLLCVLRQHRNEILDLLRREATPNVSQPTADVAPPRSESALVYVSLLDREVWIASGVEEARRLRVVATEGDTRPVLIADDVCRLKGRPKELVDCAIKALVLFGGKICDCPTLPPLAPEESGAIWFEYRDGDLVKVRGQ